MSSPPVVVDRNWVVVPDGLAAGNDGGALPLPSCVYRAALDQAAAAAGPGDCIYLAPANRFGGEVTEQEAGRRYLEPLTSARIVSVDTGDPDYIDTRGNARLLRRHLERTHQWPLRSARLIAYGPHLPRAAVAFGQEGFAFELAVAAGPIAIDRGDPATRIVRRLWYYRYPAVHWAYEQLALALTRLRII